MVKTRQLAEKVKALGLDAISLVLRALFRWPTSRKEKILCYLGILVLFFLGGAIWWFILNGGSFRLDLHDWAEVTAHRYAFLKDAAENSVFPLHTPGKWSLRNVTDRFWAVADTPLSPQFYLLRYMDIGQFVVLNTLLHYTAGFLGLLKLRKGLNLSAFSFTIGFFLFFFNGHIAANIAVGHANWATHLLLPLFIYGVIEIIKRKPFWRTVTFNSCILFFFFLEGAFHLFVACWLFLAIFLVSNLKQYKTPIYILAFSLLLSMVRVLPPLLELGNFDTAFLSGFTSSVDVIKGLIILVPPTREIVFNISPLNPLGWWEFDYYIGMFGFLFILLVGIISPFLNRTQARFFKPLFLPITGMIVLSIGRIYKIFHVLQIPMLSSQRVSSRFFIVPLMLLVIIALIQFDEHINKLKMNNPAIFALLAMGLLFTQDLWQHIKLWRITSMEALFPARTVDLSLDIVANHPDPGYNLMILIGLCISIFTLFFIIFKSRKEAAFLKQTQ